MTVLISGTWGRSYRRVTSEITVLIIGTSTVVSEVTHLYDLPQVPMITTVVSEVTHLYDLPVGHIDV
jgi:hypothetical protein